MTVLSTEQRLTATQHTHYNGDSNIATYIPNILSLVLTVVFGRSNCLSSERECPCIAGLSLTLPGPKRCTETRLDADAGCYIGDACKGQAVNVTSHSNNIIITDGMQSVFPDG